MNHLQKYFGVCQARCSALENSKTRLMRYRYKILIWLWTVNYGTMRWRVRCWQVGERKIKREERRWTLKLNSLTKPSSPVIKSKFARWWPYKGVGEPWLALNATSRLNFTAIASSRSPSPTPAPPPHATPPLHDTCHRHARSIARANGFTNSREFE